MKTIGQYYEFLSSKIVKVFSEKKITWGGVKLKYILKKKSNSDKLIVVLSACTRKGIKARYNYMRTLSVCDENQLYILDDFGYDMRGAYYLGKDGGNEIEQACVHLINEICDKLSPKKLFLCGTSKGAYAALDLMPEFDGSIAIVGAPQYRLADYLMKPENVETLSYILPEQMQRNASDVHNLNNRLRVRLKKGKHKIYLHFSDNEHTYKQHIIFLLQDLNEFGYDVHTDILHYTDHWDVGKYYPEFLLKSLVDEGCKVIKQQ